MAIIKILARHSPSYASLIRYQLRYVLDDLKADKAEIYTQNLRSDTIAGYVQEFIENESFRMQSRSDQIYLFQEVIAFHAQTDNSVITKEIIDDLVHQYFRLRGETGVILAAVHRDKEHVHIHCCVSALHFRTGKSFGLSKSQLHELKMSFQRYHKEKYPEIENSAPMHGKGEQHMSHSKWHSLKRDEIIATVQQCFSAAQSQTHFLELLREKDLHHYERSGKPTGIEHDGLKFRFLRMLTEQPFERLPIERNEEEIALAQIRVVRERQQGINERNRADEDYAR